MSSSWIRLSSGNQFLRHPWTLSDTDRHCRTLPDTAGHCRTLPDTAGLSTDLHCWFFRPTVTLLGFFLSPMPPPKVMASSPSISATSALLSLSTSLWPGGTRTSAELEFRDTPGQKIIFFLARVSWRGIRITFSSPCQGICKFWWGFVPCQAGVIGKKFQILLMTGGSWK